MSDWTSAEPLDTAQGPAVCLGDLQTLSSEWLWLVVFYVCVLLFLFNLKLFTFKAYKRQKKKKNLHTA